jgi:hypothetical protein
VGGGCWIGYKSDAAGSTWLAGGNSVCWIKCRYVAEVGLSWRGKRTESVCIYGQGESGRE